MTIRWCPSTPWRNTVQYDVMCFQAGMHVLMDGACLATFMRVTDKAYLG